MIDFFFGIIVGAITMYIYVSSKDTPKDSKNPKGNKVK